MEQDYRIEALKETFSEHARMSKQHQEQVNKVFLDQNPGQELPAHMANPFNLSEALSVICGEIENLKIRCD